MNIIISIGVLLVLLAIVGFEIILINAMSIASEKEEAMREYEEAQKIETKKTELTEEQKKKQEELRKSFENLMGYGYEDALKSKGE